MAGQDPAPARYRQEGSGQRGRGQPESSLSSAGWHAGGWGAAKGHGAEPTRRSPCLGLGPTLLLAPGPGGGQAPRGPGRKGCLRGGAGAGARRVVRAIKSRAPGSRLKRCSDPEGHDSGAGWPPPASGLIPRWDPTAHAQSCCMGGGTDPSPQPWEPPPSRRRNSPLEQSCLLTPDQRPGGLSGRRGVGQPRLPLGAGSARLPACPKWLRGSHRHHDPQDLLLPPPQGPDSGQRGPCSGAVGAYTSIEWESSGAGPVPGVAQPLAAFRKRAAPLTTQPSTWRLLASAARARTPRRQLCTVRQGRPRGHAGMGQSPRTIPPLRGSWWVQGGCGQPADGAADAGSAPQARVSHLLRVAGGFRCWEGRAWSCLVSFRHPLENKKTPRGEAQQQHDPTSRGILGQLPPRQLGPAQARCQGHVGMPSHAGLAPAVQPAGTAGRREGAEVRRPSQQSCGTRARVGRSRVWGKGSGGGCQQVGVLLPPQPKELGDPGGCTGQHGAPQPPARDTAWAPPHPAPPILWLGPTGGSPKWQPGGSGAATGPGLGTPGGAAGPVERPGVPSRDGVGGKRRGAVTGTPVTGRAVPARDGMGQDGKGRDGTRTERRGLGVGGGGRREQRAGHSGEGAGNSTGTGRDGPCAVTRPPRRLQRAPARLQLPLPAPAPPLTGESRRAGRVCAVPRGGAAAGARRGGAAPGGSTRVLARVPAPIPAPSPAGAVTVPPRTPQGTPQRPGPVPRCPGAGRADPGIEPGTTAVRRGGGGKVWLGA